MSPIVSRKKIEEKSGSTARARTRRAVRVVATPSDAELVERVRNGDEWANEALYRKYFGAIWPIVLRLLRSRADADDVVQDTFVIAFTDIASLREPEAVGAWLMQIAVRQTHRRFRRRKLLRLLGLDRSIDDAPLEQLVTRDVSPEVRAELLCVDRALDEVRHESRTAWLLRYVEGGSLEEVAAACSCSLATVKRRLRDADIAIRKHVREV